MSDETLTTNPIEQKINPFKSILTSLEINSLTNGSDNWNSQQFEKISVLMATENSYIPIQIAPKSMNIAILQRANSKLENSSNETGHEAYMSVRTDLVKEKLVEGEVVMGKEVGGRKVIFLNMAKEFDPNDSYEVSYAAHTHTEEKKDKKLQNKLEKNKEVKVSDRDFQTILENGEILGGVISENKVTEVIMKSSDTPIEFDKNKLENRIDELKKAAMEKHKGQGDAWMWEFKKSVIAEYKLLLYRENNNNENIAERVFLDD